MSTDSSTKAEIAPPPQREIGQQYAQLIDEIEELSGAWNINSILGPSEIATSGDSAKNPQSNLSPLAGDIRSVRSQLRDLRIDVREILDRVEL